MWWRTTNTIWNVKIGDTDMEVKNLEDFKELTEVISLMDRDHWAHLVAHAALDDQDMMTDLVHQSIAGITPGSSTYVEGYHGIFKKFTKHTLRLAMDQFYEYTEPWAKEMFRRVKQDKEQEAPPLPIALDREFPTHRPLQGHEQDTLYHWSTQNELVMTLDTIDYCLTEFNKYKGHPVK